MSALGPLFFWTVDLLVMAVHAAIIGVCWLVSPLVSLWYAMRERWGRQ